MSKGTLFDKVWDLHTVGTLPSGQTQLFIGLHLIHEVTSPQAFAMLRERKIKVLYPERTVATVDHIVPTENQARPFADSLAEEMIQALEKNTEENNIRFFNTHSGNQGIVHVIAPEQGLTQPGMTIACGDSHTSTHGAFGAIAFGIGTSQVRDVLASQTLSLTKLKVRKIEVNGDLAPGVYAKDVILHIIRKLGVKGGVGYAYEYSGTTFEKMSMEERMTVCNMSIEGGARCGYVNPDDVTYNYLKDKDFAPKGEKWEEAVKWWNSLRSDEDAEYDDVVTFSASDIEPTVTWGITPGQGIGISESLPILDELSESDREIALQAFEYMQLQPGESLKGTPIDVCFVGSCTNGRISDLREAAKFAKGHKVAQNVKAFIVPGSERVKQQAEAEGLHNIFINAGFEWREPGCSMCLAMNPDKLQGSQISASSSNRNFKGRQGSAQGRTLLMSPAMVVAAAINGKVADVRDLEVN
ncbi:3-isopropylmalate dehydratase large subunit [Cyanobacterium aponinum FACHB-4101]|uniref:3-isopropylmalate dehydratase large subunit n=1 Tax=Cyanobacterium aponinum (strain PCC 10605) TaxID=755178 RepID=K9Z8E1_CYAAP|nr:3-isopropylmalate dehydratase large subunit [Cyanobacterium aponinum]AFZ54997.1 3-isopropylmalate dehydratase, large subunit [Cyanobacterium aponinum PCC 10605]MBD2394217.1 3-isopropylmalate dehydratase large subunit [Cyanobacterium aponinum FACHB-4101]PHV62496.1 3-isopropylmalate dehydratase large subunit [Cyanobacterium aponinum IPPAS B-1201]